VLRRYKDIGVDLLEHIKGYYKKEANPTTQNLKSSHLKLAIETKRKSDLLKKTTDTH